MRCISNYSLNLSISKIRLQSWIVAFMFFATVVDLGGGIYLKYLSYAFSLIMLIFIKPKVGDTNGNFIITTLFFLGPLFSIFIGFINGGDLSLAITNITPFIPAILCFILINDDNIAVALNSFLSSIYLMSGITIGIYLLFTLYPSIIDSVSNFLTEKSFGMFGNKQLFITFFPGVYFKSTLFYNFAFIYYLYTAKYMRVCVIFTAILLSFSKSASAVAFIVLLLFLFRIDKIETKRLLYNKFKLFTIFLLLIIIISGIHYLEDLWLDIWNYFFLALSGRAETSTVRILHIKSLFDLFSEHPFYLIWGQGVGTTFFTKGFNAYVDNIEIDHFNTIRKFGLIWASLFYIFVLYICVKCYRIRAIRVLGFSFLLTFILVGTNPLLISPLFLMLVVLMYKYSYYYKNYEYGLSANL